MRATLLTLVLLYSAQRAAAVERTPPREGGGLLLRLAPLPDLQVAGRAETLPRLGDTAVQAGLQPSAALIEPAKGPAQPEALLAFPGLDAGSRPRPSAAAGLDAITEDGLSPGTDAPPGGAFDGRLAAPVDGPLKGRDVSGEYREARASLKSVRRPSGFAPRRRDLSALKDYKVLFVPGFLSGAFIKLSKAVGRDPQPWHYFGSQQRWLTGLGVEHELVAVHTEQSVEHNSRIVLDAIRASPKPVIIISHSKGGLDTLEALQQLRGRALEKVAGWIPVQSPFLGSPGADRVLDQPLVRYWISHFLEHPTVGGSRESLAGMTTRACERYYLSRRRRIARILREVPTVAFTSWKEIGFLDLLGELTRLGLRLNLFLNPWLLWSPLFGLALILKGVAGSLNWLAAKSDGLVPALRARLPEMDFVEEEGVDHFAPFVDHGGAFDRLEFTQALLAMVLARVKTRSGRRP